MERLIQGLQEFANLGDSVEDFQHFSKAWPDFFPVVMRSKDAALTLTWCENSRPLVLAVRDTLRAVWRGGSELDLALLLGFGRDADRLLKERQPPVALDRMLGVPTVALYEAMKQIPTEYIAELPRAIANWEKGKFQYEPVNNFQRAVELLWRQSWRAKRCSRCLKYFVADKPATRYCSPKCYGEEKKERGQTWWNEHGEAWRAERLKNESKNKTRATSSRRTKR